MTGYSRQWKKDRPVNLAEIKDDESKGLGLKAYFTHFALARRQNRLATVNHLHQAEAPRRRWLDRLPLWVVATAGIVVGGLGGVGFFYLEAPGWAFFWLALFATLGWLGYTAAPVFEEDNPVRATARPRRVQDGELVMVDLPGGRFLMGSSNADEMAREDEKPPHEVTVAPFRIAATVVTVALYRSVMSAPPSAEPETETRQPATNVSWYDAIEFCNRLSQRAGYRPCYFRRFGRWRCDWRADGYRLPTEAEWEYACRAGTTTRYFYGDDPAGLDAYAWYGGNTKTLQPVATKRANPWGLYDMHGNVWEWCWDWYGPYSPTAARNPRGPTRSKSEWRVVRGGSFGASPQRLRSARRDVNQPEDWCRFLGFRCVRVPPRHVDALSDGFIDKIRRASAGRFGFTNRQFCSRGSTFCHFVKAHAERLKRLARRAILKEIPASPDRSERCVSRHLRLWPPRAARGDADGGGVCGWALSPPD